MNPVRNEWLNELLDDVALRAPETREHLTSHLPMALHALQALGAPPARLREFHARHAGRLPVVAPVAPPTGDWRALRGTEGAYPALRAGFQRALERDGADAVLRSALPDLLPGVAAAAFHGVIRTAHAVQAGHQAELAAALAYWAWRWQPLAPPQAGEPLPFDTWADRLVTGAIGWHHSGRLIAERMAGATESALYRELAGRMAPGPLAPLAAFAAARYAETLNFTLLHMVTALRALRVLAPWAGDVAQAPVLAHAVTAAYLAARVPAHTERPAARHAGWPQVVAAAVASDDDHVIKLVHACREEAQVYGPGRYLEAATLTVA